MKKMYQEISSERTAGRIRELYRQMLSQAAEGDREARRKIAWEIFGLQREDGSWTVVEDRSAISDTDCRVEYVYIPTYYATAALMHYMNAGGKLSEEEKAHFAKGLRVAAERELNGSGYEATRGRLNALAIYKAAGLYEWMGRFEGQYPEFSEMILHVIQGFQVGLLLGRTYSDWNENFEAEFLKEVEDYEEAREPFVWYAAYGSNISRERFMRYIEHCADKSEPAEDRSFEFFHDILFADKAKNWGNQGKAYLDDRKEGRALGRIYKIRRSQFAEIQRMEGPDYTKKLHLGWEDGISVYTFTNAGIPDELNSPSAAYVDVILKGLMETYPERSELALRVYLYSRNVLSKDDRDILSYIRGSAHGVSLQDIAEDPECPCLTKARKSVKQLIELGLIRQDGRSVRAGDRIRDREAVFYTRKESRDLIDILLLAVR